MIRNITLGKMNNIRKSIILNVLASISNLIPFIALAKIVETLFLNRGADSIDTVSYTHLTLPTTLHECRSRWSPYH